MGRKWSWKAASAIAAAISVAAVAFYWLLFHSVAVATVPVREGTVVELVHGPGTVQARVSVMVSTRITATVAALDADQGDTVKRGQLLATLEDRDLVARTAAARQAAAASRNNVAAAEAALEKARADLALARSNYKRNRGLVEQKFISPAAMDEVTAALDAAESVRKSALASLAASRANERNAAHELQFAEAQLSYARIAAPMDGVITERDAEVGDTVVPGSPIFQMVDPRTLWVATRIDETVAGRIALGQSAAIRLRTGAQMAGKVARIAHESDTATREIEVDVAFRKPPARFAIGQEAEVAIAVGTARGHLVPASSLLHWQGRQGVLAVRGGRARFQPVKTEAASGGEVLVDKGLAIGTAVVLKPQGVRPGERVRAAQGS